MLRPFMAFCTLSQVKKKVIHVHTITIFYPPLQVNVEDDSYLHLSERACEVSPELKAIPAMKKSI